MKFIVAEDVDSGEYHSTTIKKGDTVRGYVALHSADGGRSQEFWYSYGTGTLRPYFPYSGQINWRTIGPRQPQMYLSRGDAMKSIYHHPTKYNHIFRAVGRVDKVHRTSRRFWFGNLVDCSEITLLEEDSKFTLGTEQFGWFMNYFKSKEALD